MLAIGCTAVRRTSAAMARGVRARSARPVAAAALLLPLLIVAAAMRGSAAGARAGAVPADERCHVLFFSLPTRGHVNPLVGLAEELQARGCTVTFPLPAGVLHWLDGSEISGVPVDMDLDAHLSVQERVDKLKPTGGNPLAPLFGTVGRFMNQSRPIAEHLLRQWERDPSEIPDVMVLDFAGIAGLALARRFELPLVVNNPGMIMFNSKLVDALHVPATFSHIPYEMNVLQRIGNVVFAIAFHIFDFAVGHTIDTYYATVDPNAAPLYRLNAYAELADAVLCNTVLGFDYPRPLSPRVHMVGPMERRVQRDLPAELSEWLDARQNVVYVSFGTMVVLEREHVFNLTAAFERVGVPVVWSFATDQREYLGVSAADMPSNVRLETYVAQPELLRHRNVAAFYTHGGANSAHDVLSAGKPVVCTPFFGDQPDVCQKMVSQGFGEMVPRKALLASNVYDALSKVLSVKSYRERTERIARVFARSGGASEGADVVLLAMQGELDHERAAPRPLYQEYNVDYMVAFAALVLVGWYTMLCCARCCVRCCRPSPKVKTE